MIWYGRRSTTGVTSRVTVPGDTNPSDAADTFTFLTRFTQHSESSPAAVGMFAIPNHFGIGIARRPLLLVVASLMNINKLQCTTAMTS